VGLLTRFKSNERLQAEALDILTEMIRRNLLTASVYISDPACVFFCAISSMLILREAGTQRGRKFRTVT
jgi:hypothetical protein